MELAATEARLQQAAAACEQRAQLAAALQQQLAAAGHQGQQHAVEAGELRQALERKEVAVGRLQRQIGDMDRLLQGMKAQCGQQLAGMEQLRERVARSEEAAATLRWA